MPRLPPLAAIRVFEAAARHESFTKAAAELGMTQAAVSYQVKLLEERVGAPLFHRTTRKVVLSEAGRKLAPPVADAFQRLQGAFDALHETSEGVLSVTAVHTFASNWMVPRLGAFQMSHPNIAVRLETSTRMVDFAREEFDVGIRAGRGTWPGLKSHKLLDVSYAPLLSPELVESEKIREPADLLRVPLLDWSADDNWRRWFKVAGVADPKPLRNPNISMATQQMLGNAAMTGQGAALVLPLFFSAELASGRLVQPFDITVRAEVDYYLVYLAERQNAPKIRAFRDWLLKEIGQDKSTLTSAA